MVFMHVMAFVTNFIMWKKDETGSIKKYEIVSSETSDILKKLLPLFCTVREFWLFAIR